MFLHSLVRLKALHLLLGTHDGMQGQVPVPFVGAVPRRGWPCQLWLPPPAVALLLSGVTSSRAWVELEGEGRAQLVRFHALGEMEVPCICLMKGPSLPPPARHQVCCWPSCQEGWGSGTELGQPCCRWVVT